MAPTVYRGVFPLFACVLFSASKITVATPQNETKPGGETHPVSAEAAKKLKNPVPYSKKSIGQGKIIFARNCTACHGEDGKALVDVVANATDLTSPEVFRDGTTDGEIFKSIQDGAGEGMPAFDSQIPKEEDRWHLVNFIRSLWPESKRPPSLVTVS